MKAYLEIELPKSCCECDIKSWDGEDDVCPFSGISALSIGRQDDCPLVPVPPHGRLIDADALIEWLYSDEPNALKAPFRLCTADRSDVIFLVKNAPTIIQAEEGE